MRCWWKETNAAAILNLRLARIAPGPAFWVGLGLFGKFMFCSFDGLHDQRCHITSDDIFITQ
jgi:hypothetical protein